MDLASSRMLLNAFVMTVYRSLICIDATCSRTT